MPEPNRTPRSEEQPPPAAVPSPAGSGSPAGDVGLPDPGSGAEVIAPEIAADDPILDYLQTASGVVDLTHLDLDSPALGQLQAGGVALVVPLVTNGELVGLLNVGSRLSEQEYSADDRRLLETLARQAAPAIRVGQLIRERQAEVQERGRIEQELHVAQMIQQNFLPKEVPLLEGWRVAADYRPARAVGGDFFDFIDLSDGRIGLLIGDVTDKGIPAAMVMAATKSLLRASAQRLLDPAVVLARVNDQICPEIPENMFVTCFYGVLDPATGGLRYANAGHNLPLVQTADEASELRATGMPLGLMAEMEYEEHQTTLARGARVLLYSDGLVEAHDSDREMFGTARVADVLRLQATPDGTVRLLLDALDRFTAESAEQEDDITLVALEREPADPTVLRGGPADSRQRDGTDRNHDAQRLLADFTITSVRGNERDATRRVAEALTPIALPARRIERLKTAVAEATMNAIEHGNGYDPALEVRIVVQASASAVAVRISDHGTGGEIAAAEIPDIDAKLAVEQSPRGWGLLLIKEMVDSMRDTSEDGRHVIELVMHTEGGNDAAGHA
jgi:serine phosphatase RsbU (regulator of sigma subunit)/anti-sigma regulatory factor (Ser/Thr protein kinase)